MVFFSCNACGESLKKANVEKHYLTKCRACEVLSCLDCGKDFYGDGYKEHTSCISEDQKYGGKNFKAAPHKGAVRQTSWTEMVHGASMDPSLNPKVRSTFKSIINCGHDNIPRKKAKFMNFVKNSMHVRDSWVVEQVWKTIENYVEAQKKQSDQSKATEEEDAKGNNQLGGKNHSDNAEVMTEGEVEEKESTDDANKRDKRHTVDRKRKRQGDPLDEAGRDKESLSEEQPKKKKKKKKKRDDGEPNVDAVSSRDDGDGLDKSPTGAVESVDSSEHSRQNGISEPLMEEGEQEKRKKKRKGEVGDEPLKTLGMGDNHLGVTNSQSKSHRPDGYRREKKCKKRKKEEKENGLKEDAEDQGDEDVADGPDDGDNLLQPHRAGGKFKWEAVITEVLQNAGGEIRLKKLKKKVFAEYFAQGGDSSITSEEKLFTKFKKKVMKNPQFKVHKEIVHLKQ